MKKIVTIVGARPQFIKAAVLSRLIQSKEWNSLFKEVIVHTGQHYDHGMSEVFFDEMKIPEPNYNLNIGSGTHGRMTGEMLIKIEEVLLKEKPDFVLVYGDTNSTLAGALAASKLHIPVVHVEAGLRSFNMEMPEEQNRILTDRISTLLFAPTDNAVQLLKNEGIKHGVHMVGDIMYDAALFYREKNKSQFVSNLGIDEFSLATVHRAENTDDKDRLCQIFSGFSKLPETIVLPLHPRTRKKLLEFKIDIPENIKVVEPVGYFDMLDLEANARFIFTDSGGVQKEAYFFKKPCFTLRDETEWVETVKSGWNTLVGADSKVLLSAYNNYVKPDQYVSHYGNGNTSELILSNLKSC